MASGLKVKGDQLPTEVSEDSGPVVPVHNNNSKIAVVVEQKLATNLPSGLHGVPIDRTFFDNFTSYIFEPSCLAFDISVRATRDSSLSIDHIARGGVPGWRSETRPAIVRSAFLKKKMLQGSSWLMKLVEALQVIESRFQVSHVVVLFSGEGLSSTIENFFHGSPERFSIRLGEKYLGQWGWVLRR